MSDHQTHRNGCFDRPPYPQVYFSTRGNVPIKHVLTRDCQYTHSNLGKIDPACEGCKHKAKDDS